jgi:hypothetical protein
MERMRQSGLIVGVTEGTLAEWDWPHHGRLGEEPSVNALGSGGGFTMQLPLERPCTHQLHGLFRQRAIILYQRSSGEPHAHRWF